jgi:hypothetical protein
VVVSEPEVEEPLYRHECSLCTFLGVTENNGRKYDLYFCLQGHLRPTVIARRSNAPHDYTSGIESVPHDPLLLEAFERAKRLDLIPKDATGDEEA